MSRLYSAALAAHVLSELARGRSLRAICEAPDMPAEATIRNWAVSDHEGFGERMQRARALGCHAIADQIIEIADAATDSDSAAAARVKCENRRWLLSKLMPATYGDRQVVEHAGGAGVVIVVTTGVSRNPGERLEPPTIDVTDGE